MMQFFLPKMAKTKSKALEMFTRDLLFAKKCGFESLKKIELQNSLAFFLKVLL